MHFGQTLRVMRTTAGLSLRELAKRLGVSPAYISQVERGKARPPTDERIRQIEKILALPAGSLLSATGRVESEIDEFLADVPEACDFIRQAQETRLGPADFGALTALLRKGGPRALRSLLDNAIATNGHASYVAPQKPVINSSTCYLSGFLRKDRIFPVATCLNKDELFGELAAKVAPFVANQNAASLLALLWDREEDATTGVGAGIAVPHAIVPDMKETKLFLARLEQGVDYGSIDGEPVHLCFIILCGAEQRNEHLKLLGRIARLCSHPYFCRGVRQARSAASVLRFMQKTVTSIP